MTITEEIITRTVRKDNTALYKGNRYSVPLGTYRPEMVLKVIEQDDTIILRDIDSGQVVAEHRLCAQKEPAQNNNHLRDHSVKIAELYEQTLALLGGTEETAFFNRHPPRKTALCPGPVQAAAKTCSRASPGGH